MSGPTEADTLRPWKTDTRMGSKVDLARFIERPVGRLQLLLLIGLAAAGTMLLAAILAGGVEKIDFQVFIVLTLFYAAASVTFLVSRAKTGRRVAFDLPVLLTLVCFLRYALVPAAAFIDPDYMDPYLHRGEYRLLNWTLFIVISGMLAFWAGCRIWPQKTPSKVSDENRPAKSFSRMPLAWAVALFGISLAARLYITRYYGYGYSIKVKVYLDNLLRMETLLFVASLGLYALTIIAIEMCYHPRSRFRRWLFVAIFFNEIFWGAISGMKIELFKSFLLMAAIISMTKARFDKKWIVAVLAGFIVVYPVHDRYRQLVGGGTVEVRSIRALGQAGNAAFSDTSREEAGWQGWLASGWGQTLRRFDLLQNTATVISLTPWEASRVRGDERWWMLPFYPFVPRFIWPGKPALLRGIRLSMVLGAGGETDTAMTYPGDLYMDYGLLGVLVGMFALGIVAQSITNRIVDQPGKRDLFFYTNMFLFFSNVMEVDAFPVWVSFIKTTVFLGVMTFLIYGPKRAKTANDLPAVGSGAEMAGVPSRRAAFFRPAL